MVEIAFEVAIALFRLSVCHIELEGCQDKDVASLRPERDRHGAFVTVDTTQCLQRNVDSVVRMMQCDRQHSGRTLLL